MEFKFSEDGWNGMMVERVTELMSHLPPTVSELSIEDADFGAEMMNAIIKHVWDTQAWLRV